MDIKMHYEKFSEIIKKYGLDKDKKADEVADYLMKNKIFSAEEFARDFAMEKEDAQIFLDFVKKGLDFKNKTSK